MKFGLDNVRRRASALACAAFVLFGAAGAAVAQKGWKGDKRAFKERQKFEKRVFRQELRARRRQANWQRIGLRRERRDDRNFWNLRANRRNARVNPRFVRNGRLHYSPARSYFYDRGRRPNRR